MWSSNRQNESLNKEQSNQSSNQLSSGPSSGQSSGPSKDDLHYWSIFRQNLNAHLSSSSDSGQTNDLVLRQSTVENILSSKDKTELDADNYLKYGLPRVKGTNINHININSINKPVDNETAGCVNVKNQIKLFNEKQQSVQNVIKKFDNLAENRTNSKHKISSKYQQSDDPNNQNKIADENLIKKSNSAVSSLDKTNEACKTGDKTFDKRDISDKSDKSCAKLNKLLDKLNKNDKLSTINSISKWNSNPILSKETLLKDTDSYLTKLNVNKQSISAYNVNDDSSSKDLAKQLEQFKEFQNEQQNKRKVYMINKDQNRSDNDSLTKSLTKSSPCDELDFRKSSLNEDDLSFEQTKLNKYTKTSLMQSSDSEFVLSLDTKSTSFKSKQPHLTVTKLYHEFDSTSLSSVLCGGARQKIRVLDNVAFEVKAGDMLALIATNRKFYFIN